jgi:hypothetical protein
MYHCINCGRRAATRQNDTFTCGRCGFEWDVAFEQANAAYLRAQGREPATAAGAVPLAAATADSTTQMLADLATPVRFEDLENPILEGVSPEVILSDDLPAGTLVGEGESLADRAAAIEPAYDALTVEDLRALAEERGVDLAGRTRKADIIAALREADGTI